MLAYNNLNTAKELINVSTIYETAPNSRRLEQDAGYKMIDTAVKIAYIITKKPEKSL